MDSLTASIALCTYDGAAFLEQQLASLAAQACLPTELVVVDDGSSDETMAILARFTARAPFPVHVHRNATTLGYRANFMKAAGLCRGDLIFFCDQDDIWSIDKIERMQSAFADPDVLLAYHNARLIDEKGQGQAFQALLYDDTVQRRILAQTPMPPWHYTLGFTQVVRRSLLSHDALWPRSRDHMTEAVMAHDQWYIFLAAALGRVAYVAAPLVCHRQHRHNAYGVVATGYWHRFASRFDHDPDWDRLARDAAAERAALLALIAPDALPASRIAEAQLGYAALASRHHRRFTAYRAGFGRRWRTFVDALMQGDYAGKPWGFDPRAIPRDLLLGPIRGKGAK